MQKDKSFAMGKYSEEIINWFASAKRWMIKKMLTIAHILLVL